MEYTKDQMKYIDTVDGCAHQSAVDIIGQKDAEIDELRKRVESNDFWKGIVLAEEEKLDVSQVEKELADYKFLMEQVPLVYMHVTGGKLSKTNYYACSVISAFTDHLQDIISDELEDKAAEIEQLKAAITETLEDNGHLADGDDCTLIKLKKAIGGKK